MPDRRLVRTEPTRKRPDAAAAHRGAVPLADGGGGDHAAAAALLEAMIRHGNAVRRVRPNNPVSGGEGADPQAS